MGPLQLLQLYFDACLLNECRYLLVVLILICKSYKKDNNKFKLNLSLINLFL